MNSLRCSKCSFLNFATAGECKRCGLKFDSAQHPEWAPPPFAPSGAFPPSTEGGAHYWSQPPYQTGYVPPPTARATSATSTIVKIGVAVAVVFLVALLAIPVLLKSRKTDFTKLSWTEYRAPDNKFSISLPAVPNVSEVAIPTPIGNAQAHVIKADINKDSGCMLLYADYPVERINISEENLYDTALKGVMNRQSLMGVGARKYVTLNGYKGIEAELKPTNPAMKETGGVRLFWITPRLSVVVAGGPDTPEFKAVQAKCFDSFTLK
jgi:hypothetical protein